MRIEDKLAPRSLTRGQLDALSEKLKSHPRVSIDILQIGESPEIVNLRHLISDALETAGWNPRTWTVTGSGVVLGILVSVHKDANEGEKKAAQTLASLLNADGIASEMMPPFQKGADWPSFVMGPPYDSAKQAPIRMYIGTKP